LETGTIIPQTVTPDVLAVNRELPVKPEAEAQPVQERADALFGSGVLAADAAHVPGTALAR
jgi:hypothetical protein